MEENIATYSRVGHGMSFDKQRQALGCSEKVLLDPGKTVMVNPFEIPNGSLKEQLVAKINEISLLLKAFRATAGAQEILSMICLKNGIELSRSERNEILSIIEMDIQKDDYIEGYEHYGSAIQKIRGWVGG